MHLTTPLTVANWILLLDLITPLAATKRVLLRLLSRLAAVLHGLLLLYFKFFWLEETVSAFGNLIFSKVFLSHVRMRYLGGTSVHRLIHLLINNIL